MREWKVRLTPQAQEQIREIVLYERDDLCMPQAARRLFEELAKAIEGLARMPDRFRIVEVKPLQSAGVRRMNVRKYSVFYIADEAMGVVGVFAVLYGTPSEQRLLRAFQDDTWSRRP